jgi:uncharacterized membrane protein
MSLYEALIIIHILTAAILIGGVVVIGMMLSRVVGAGDERDVVGFTNLADFAGRVFGPISLVLLATGIWGASEGNWDFGDAWISIGFAGWIALTIVALTFHRVNGRRTREVVEQQGACSPWSSGRWWRSRASRPFRPARPWPAAPRARGCR